MRYTFSARDSFEDEDDSWDDPFDEDYGGDPYRCFIDNSAIAKKAGSSTDCTGLIPSLPNSDEELESYAQMYHYPGDILED